MLTLGNKVAHTLIHYVIPTLRSKRWIQGKVCLAGKRYYHCWKFSFLRWGWYILYESVYESCHMCTIIEWVRDCCPFILIARFTLEVELWRWNYQYQDAIRTMKAYPIASTMAKFETYDFGTDDCSFEVEWKGIHAIIWSSCRCSSSGKDGFEKAPYQYAAVWPLERKQFDDISHIFWNLASPKN